MRTCEGASGLRLRYASIRLYFNSQQVNSPSVGALGKIDYPALLRILAELWCGFPCCASMLNACVARWRQPQQQQ